MLSGLPGFLHSPQPRRLVVGARPLPGDPARDHIKIGAPLGFVGLELHTKRRNRLTGKVIDVGDGGFTLSVDQSFGNCPQYIQTRVLEEAMPPETPPTVHALGSRLDERAAAILARCDTLFIASASPGAGGPDPVEGVDVNHRGGRPGFVRVQREGERTVLTFPDFVGNSAFNTLGNLTLNPRAGLLVLDFASGDLVTLTGRAEVIWSGAEVRVFQGAERLVRISVDEAYRLVAALPWRWSKEQIAPELSGSGNWAEVERAEQAGEMSRGDRPFRIARIQVESPTVRTLDLEPVDREGLASYEPGQFLPVAVARDGRWEHRTYSLARMAEGTAYQISVRREPHGAVSGALHDLTVGAQLQVRAPEGRFQLDPESRRSVVLIGGGIGLTPLLAMADFLTGGTQARLRFPDRPVYLIHAVRNGADHPFRERLQELQHRPNLSCVLVYSTPRPEDVAGRDYHVAGRLDRRVLRAVLPLDDHDVYLCGPPGFMQAVYDALITLGVRDERIHSEAFGPSSLTRVVTRRPVAADRSPGELTSVPPESAQVTFAASGRSARWQPGMTLLELAEASGLEVPSSCRVGRCGTCRTGLLTGRVTYPRPPQAAVGPADALLCQGEPADPAITLNL